MPYPHAAVNSQPLSFKPWGLFIGFITRHRDTSNKNDASKDAHAIATALVWVSITQAMDHAASIAWNLNLIKLAPQEVAAQTLAVL